MEETNWVVITGAPSSGKTTLIEALHSEGYRVTNEVARELIVSSLKKNGTGKALNRATLAAQQEILALKNKREANLPSSELIFFDRGLPDSIAYYRYYHLPDNEPISQSQIKHYKHVFFLEGLPVVNDGVRQENDKTARQIGELIYQAYVELGYKVIRLPAVSVCKRLDLVLSNITKG